MPFLIPCPEAARTHDGLARRVALAVAATLLVSAGARAQPGYTPPRGVQQRPVAVNRIAMQLTNCGSFASSHLFDGGPPDLGLEYPRGSAKYLAFAGGVWFAARAQGELRTAVTDYTTEFVPGPAVAGGPGVDTLRFRIYSVTRGDTTGSGEWMARGVPLGAPVDASGMAPGLIGDQTLWTVFTDAGVTRQPCCSTPRTPIGLEVQATAYAFDCAPALTDVVFLHVRLLHKGSDALDGAYVGLWYDADIRTATIPAASDSSLDVGYVYRINDDITYGVAGPATGVCVLRGPHRPGAAEGLRPGAIVAWPNATDPQLPEAIQGVLHGLYPWGVPMVDSTTFQTTHFYASGDPVTGEGWLMPNRYDMKLVVSMGPFTFAPGDTQEVDAAVVVGQGRDRSASVTAMRDNIREARAAFADGFRSLPAPRLTTTGRMIARPVPSPGGFVFDLMVPAGGAEARIDILDLSGRRVRTIHAGVLGGGLNHLAWDGLRDGGERARPGVYFARAHVAGNEFGTRVVLIP